MATSVNNFDGGFDPSKAAAILAAAQQRPEGHSGTTMQAASDADEHIAQEGRRPLEVLSGEIDLGEDEKAGSDRDSLWSQKESDRAAEKVRVEVSKLGLEVPKEQIERWVDQASRAAQFPTTNPVINKKLNRIFEEIKKWQPEGSESGEPEESETPTPRRAAHGMGGSDLDHAAAAPEDHQEPVAAAPIESTDAAHHSQKDPDAAVDFSSITDEPPKEVDFQFQPPMGLEVTPGNGGQSDGDKPQGDQPSPPPAPEAGTYDGWLDGLAEHYLAARVNEERKTAIPGSFIFKIAVDDKDAAKDIIEDQKRAILETLPPEAKEQVTATLDEHFKLHSFIASEGDKTILRLAAPDLKDDALNHLKEVAKFEEDPASDAKFRGYVLEQGFAQIGQPAMQLDDKQLQTIAQVDFEKAEQQVVVKLADEAQSTLTFAEDKLTASSSEQTALDFIVAQAKNLQAQDPEKWKTFKINGGDEEHLINAARRFRQEGLELDKPTREALLATYKNPADENKPFKDWAALDAELCKPKTASGPQPTPA